MSITLIQKPDTLTPVYNPMVWVFSSTLVNEQGFRYVVKILDKDDNVVVKLRVTPEPNNGYGYCDISKIISDNITYDLNMGSVQSAANSLFSYKINISEEFLYSFHFYDTEFVPEYDLTYTKLKGSSAPLFSIGDFINIVVDTEDTETIKYSFIEGLFDIIDIIGNDIIVKKDFIATPTNPGQASLSDRTKILLNGPTYTNNYAFNGVRQFDEFGGLNSWNSNYYNIEYSSSLSKYFLTDIPDNFYVTRDQDIWINLYKLNDNGNINLIIENSNGDKFIKTGIWFSGLGKISQFPAGPNNILIDYPITGTYPLLKTNTLYYDFWAVSATTGNQITKKYRFYIDRRCKIEDYEILFMDRLGSFSSFAFQLRSNETGSVDRLTYNKKLGDVGLGGYSYDVTDAGQTIYSVNYSKRLELNTNFMTDEMSVYFEQLYTSPVTFLKKGGHYYSVTIQDNGFVTERQKNKRLIKKSIIVEFNNKNISNI